MQRKYADKLENEEPGAIKCARGAARAGRRTCPLWATATLPTVLAWAAAPPTLLGTPSLCDGSASCVLVGTESAAAAGHKILREAEAW